MEGALDGGWGVGCVGVLGCLTGSWSNGGLVVMLCLCPSQYRQEGAERAAPSFGSHRWALWSVIMGSVPPRCISALFIRETNNKLAISECVWSYTSMCKQYVHMCISPPVLIFIIDKAFVFVCTPGYVWEISDWPFTLSSMS